MAANSQISIVAVGDIMLGDGVQRIRRGVRAAWHGRNTAQLLDHLKPVLSGSDLCIGNLECMVGDVHPANPRRMTYKAEAAHLPGLKMLGFTHLSLANNHILDEGLSVAHQSEQITAAAGIAPLCGPNPKRTSVKGVSIDIFTFNLIRDHASGGFYRDGVAEEDFTQIRASDADVKIVCIHWGDEYAEYPSPAQIDLAHRFVDCGVQAVLGHHPHVIQGVEKYKDSIIAYSLGNFVFDMDWSARTRSALIVELEIAGKAVTKIKKGYVESGKDYIPQPVEPSANLLELDRNVLRFAGRASAYGAYSKSALRKARVGALVNLFGRFYTVHPKTWEILFGRRLQKFFPRLRHAYAN